ncbi:hypothetical protein ACIPWF_01860 [Paenarthrobacter sp. NPDC089989]|uniref:hypothetical protein n=1 Tax=unclassified Paenarthrobacter TaxID=2634190 RepID=UPI003805F37A
MTRPGTEAGNARRRKRRLALWSAPAALAALAVAAKLLSIGALGGAAAEAFAAGNQHGVSDAAGGLLFANVLEPHKALVASGDAHVVAGDFTSARSEFTKALNVGPGDDECKVRVNLALSIEKLGDSAASSRDPQAAALYAEALEVVQEAPASCHEDGPGNGDGEGQRLDAARERLEAKKTSYSGESPSKDQGSGQPSVQQQDQLQQLQESARKAQSERTEGQDRDRYLRGPDDSGVDRPW